jgi:hypothetical protein
MPGKACALTEFNASVEASENPLQVKIKTNIMTNYLPEGLNKDTVVAQVL